jgi:hypothetical protein
MGPSADHALLFEDGAELRIHVFSVIGQDISVGHLAEMWTSPRSSAEKPVDKGMRWVRACCREVGHRIQLQLFPRPNQNDLSCRGFARTGATTDFAWGMMPGMSSAAPPDPLNLDGRVFDMVSSTASQVDPDAPTRFTYHERDGLLWGEYAGDTVRTGRFVGSRRNHEIMLHFGHIVEATGDLVTGEAGSTIEVDPAGRIELVERFGDDGGETSICREIRSGS